MGRTMRAQSEGQVYELPPATLKLFQALAAGQATNRPAFARSYPTSSEPRRPRDHRSADHSGEKTSLPPSRMRADPIICQFLKRDSRLNSVFWVACRRIIHVSTDITRIFASLSSCCSSSIIHRHGINKLQFRQTRVQFVMALSDRYLMFIFEKAQ